MAVIPAFRDGWTVLRENPVILLGGFLLAIAGQLAATGEIVDSLAVIAVGFVAALLLSPFLLGGIIGMALEALEGSTTTLERLAESGRACYLSLLGASILFGMLMFGVTFAAMFIGVFGVALGFGVAGVEGGTAGLIGVGISILVTIVVLLLVFLLFLFLQFYNTAIVVENERAFSSFSRSISVVRSNLLSVVGYSILWIGIGMIAFAPIVGLELALVEPGLADGIGETVGYAITALAGIVVTGLLYSYLYTVHTAYYRRLIPTVANS
ncbi:hypothetical protein [Natrialba sp. INN-245]|uniref:DUF7847 domain-containing protein n=1 Tax=Natrialba sp. INN-245 TaxID=2690967 RepID=UPI00130F828E|nr:hypothetical protein [Natrialba sp. INN-245]MWV41683.1 hypothetical protein [Natrialba sp. INN-245]